MPGSPEGEQPNFSIPPDPDEKRYLRDTLTDYSAMFTYIRADKSTPVFLEDLRDNKTNLLSCFNEIFDDRENPIYEEPSGMRALKTKYHVAMYLNKILQLHVFDMDPYREERNSFLREQYTELDSSRMSSVAAEWLETHPDSEAAKDIALLGADAPLYQRQRLLQEMWPTYVPILTNNLEKKS